MEKRNCLNCKEFFYKKVNISKKNWKNVKYCSVKCKHEDGRVELKCSICGNNFICRKSHKDLLKTCSSKCARKLNSINSIMISKKFGPPILRGNALQKMTETKRKQFNNGEVGHLKNVWKKNSGNWIAEKNPRWCPIGTKKPEGKGYINIKVAEGKGQKNWKVEHIYNMEQNMGIEINTKTHCVHHIDFNKENNKLDNLLLMTITEHKKLHGKKFDKLLGELINKNLVFFDKSEKTYKVK